MTQVSRFPLNVLDFRGLRSKSVSIFRRFHHPTPSVAVNTSLLSHSPPHVSGFWQSFLTKVRHRTLWTTNLTTSVAPATFLTSEIRGSHSSDDKKIPIFWNTTPRTSTFQSDLLSPSSGYSRNGCLDYPKNGYSKSLQNTGTYIPIHPALHRTGLKYEPPT